MTFLRRMLLPWSVTLVLVGLCLMPRSYVPSGEKVPKLFPNVDKVVHFGMFAGFALGWMFAGPTLTPSRSRAVWVLAASLALAAGTELLQGLPQVGRDPSLYDMLADAAGGLASVFGLAWLRGPSRRAGPPDDWTS
jgi:VanZ family protein